MTRDRQVAIDYALRVMRKGLPWGTLRQYTRDEMYERSTPPSHSEPHRQGAAPRSSREVGEDDVIC
jgi:hypothetical protein